MGRVRKGCVFRTVSAFARLRLESVDCKPRTGVPFGTPPKRGAKGERQRVEGSFETALDVAGVRDFRFHDLRHTFASWFMMNGGDLYELAKILGREYQDDRALRE